MQGPISVADAEREEARLKCNVVETNVARRRHTFLPEFVSECQKRCPPAGDALGQIIGDRFTTMREHIALHSCRGPGNMLSPNCAMQIIVLGMRTVSCSKAQTCKCAEK